MYDLPRDRYEIEQAMALMLRCHICDSDPGRECVTGPDSAVPGTARHPHESRIQPARDNLHLWRHRNDAKVDA